MSADLETLDLCYYRFTPEGVVLVLQVLGLAKQGPFRQGWN